MLKYLHSEILNLPLKLNTDTGEITVKDLKKLGSRGYVKYSGNEIRILNKLGGISPEIHLVKNIFDGEIVEVMK